MMIKEGVIVFFIGFALIMLWLWWDSVRYVKPETIIIKRVVKGYYGLCGWTREYKEVTENEYYSNYCDNGWVKFNV